MNNKLNNLLKNLSEKEITIFLNEIFNIKNNKVIYHIKENRIYIYTNNNSNKLTIYEFTEEKENKTISNNIQTIKINKEKSYNQYKKGIYTNITLLASILYTSSKEEQLDIVNKMKIIKIKKDKLNYLL